MRIGYLECFSGISGDMLLGALVDAGVPFALLQETTAALNVGARLEMRKVSRGGLAGTKVDVIVPDDNAAVHDHSHDPADHGHAAQSSRASACTSAHRMSMTRHTRIRMSTGTQTARFTRMTTLTNDHAISLIAPFPRSSESSITRRLPTR